MGGHLHGSHVVESVVQLLADGFVLQFLSVQLVYEQEVGGREAKGMKRDQRWRVSVGGMDATPHSSKKGQCVEEVEPQQVASAGGVHFVFK